MSLSGQQALRYVLQLKCVGQRLARANLPIRS